MLIVVFANTFKIFNKSYAEFAAPYAKKYLMSSFLSTTNQFNKMLQESDFEKQMRNTKLSNFLEINKLQPDEGLNALQWLSMHNRKGDFLDDFDFKLKSVNSKNPVALLQMLFYSIFTTGLWKIVLVFLIMALASALKKKVSDYNFDYNGVAGGKLSRKAKNNKKTKKPKFLKRAKKTLRRRKISGGGNTDNIENMKNLTGITYFLLSAFSGYYSSLSSIPVPKFMYNAVKVFLKL